MDVTSFYQGVLHELEKSAAPVDQRKKPWSRNLAPALLAAGGLGAMGYGGYKLLQGGQKAGTPSAPASTPQSAASVDPNQLNLKNPVIAHSLYNAHNAKPVIDHDPSTMLDKGVGLASAGDFVGSVAGLGATGANAVSKGALFNSAAGKVLKPLATYGAKELAPGLAKATWGNLRPTVNSGMIGALNFADALHDNDSLAGKAMGTAGAAGGTLIPGAGTAAFLTKIPLHLSEGYQESNAKSTGQLTDMMFDAYKAMRSPDPAVAAQGREAAQQYFSNPMMQKWIDHTVHPSLFNRMAQRNFGLANGVVSSLGGALPSAYDKGDTVLNTGALQHIMEKMRGNLAQNQVQ